jgi:hypothetical protein
VNGPRLWSCEELVGKRLLVGITYVDCDGELVRQEEFHGPIVQADQCAVILERTDAGQHVSLPPGCESAMRGKYRLRSTGEIVMDPDFVVQWTFVEEGEGPEGARL